MSDGEDEQATFALYIDDPRIDGYVVKGIQTADDDKLENLLFNLRTSGVEPIIEKAVRSLEVAWEREIGTDDGGDER